ncbi:MAG: phage head-tail connector protein [candidate division Zixibacteria bacterium]|nr:phage head-tail connector protein [candidate division Zixibacteria bacterium]
MRLKLKTAPAVEPVTLTEAKNQLRVDGAEDNALITALITTARQLAERDTKRAFITQTWKMYLDSVPEEIEIPKPPLQSVESIKTISTVESIVDQDSNAGQPILSVASTTGFAEEDTIIINRDGAREEEKIILSVQDEISLTMTENLTNPHTETQADRVERYSLVSRANYNVDASQNSPGRVKLRTGYNWPIHRGFASFLLEFKAGYGDGDTDVPEALRQGVLQLIGHLYENRGAEEIPKGIKALFWPYKILRI